MPFVLAPLELLIAIVALFFVFRVFRKALNSRKLDTVIEEVAHPDHHTLDGALDGLNRARDVAFKASSETDGEIERKRRKNEQLRNAYGGNPGL